MTRLSIQRPLTVLMAILTVVLLGAVAFTYLKVDRLPPISFPVVFVDTFYPQATAQDVEELVTKPIEDALAGVSGAETIESTSSEGRSRVRVRLYAGTNPDLASLEVERRIARVRGRLPVDVDDPSVRKADPNEFPVMNIAVTGAPLDQLFELADTQFQPQLQSVPGISSVNIQGGLQREIQVRVEYAKLAAYNLSVQQISNALAEGNVASTVGSTDQGMQTLNIRAMGKFESPQDLAYLVVAQSPDGAPILLRDVAAIGEGYKEQRQVQRFNGQPAVGLSVVKNSEANALETAAGVKEKLKELQALLPAGAQTYVTNDLSLYTKRSLEAVEKDLLLAILLVGLIVLLFLHEWRNVLIILLAIPTCLITAFLVMYILGFSLNLMTLMALALSVGILVDDSIVVIENIHRHHQLGAEPREAALTGRMEIGMAAVAIALADMIVYVPIAFMAGFEGQLFRQYGLTIVACTVASLLVSFTLTPMLASRLLRHDDGRGLLSRFGTRWDAGFDRVAAAIQRVVPRVVRVRWLVLGLSLVLVLGAMSLIQTRAVGIEYAPQEDNGNLRVDVRMPPGASLLATDRAATQVEETLMAMPEVQGVFTTLAVAGVRGGQASARMEVQLVPAHDRHKALDEIVADVRRLGRQVPGARVSPSVQSPLPGGGSSGRLDMDISGPELDVLQDLVASIIMAAETVEGLTDVQDDASQSSRELRINLEPARMARLNVTSQQAMDALRTTLGGRVVSVLRSTGKTQQDISVIAADVDRNDLEKLTSIPVRGGANLTGSGVANPVVTLGQVATLSYAEGPAEINRVNRNRTISVQGTAIGRPLGDVARDFQAAAFSVERPAGYSVKPGRQVNRFNTAMAAFGQALILAVILEYMLLVGLYESWVYPLVLMFSVPLGLIGSIAALAVTGNTLNMFSIIGLIMAFGLVAKNGILLVDFTNQLRKRGVDRTQALGQAVRTRLRPIVMTSATMAGGMLPLALKLEAGSESRAPMAVVVIGAILTSTALAVFVIPAVYVLLDDMQVLVGSLFGRGAPQPVLAGATPVQAGVSPEPALPAATSSGLRARAWLVLRLLRAGSTITRMILPGGGR